MEEKNQVLYTCKDIIDKMNVDKRFTREAAAVAAEEEARRR